MAVLSYNFITVITKLQCKQQIVIVNQTHDEYTRRNRKIA